MKKYISVLVSVALLVLICVLVARFGFVEQESPVEQTTQTKEPLTDPVLILSSENSVEWNSEEYCVDAEAQLNAYLYYFSAKLEGNRTYKLKLNVDSDKINEDGYYGFEKYGAWLFGEYYWSDDQSGFKFNIEKGDPDMYDTTVTCYFTLGDLPDNHAIVRFYTHGSYDVECFPELDPAEFDILSFELYCVQ